MELEEGCSAFMRTVVHVDVTVLSKTEGKAGVVPLLTPLPTEALRYLNCLKNNSENKELLILLRLENSSIEQFKSFLCTNELSYKSPNGLICRNKKCFLFPKLQKQRNKYKFKMEISRSYVKRK